MKTPLRREIWLCLIDLVENMWRTGDTPQELGWTILDLIPKKTTVTRGIGLMETLRKVVETLIDTFLCNNLQMHNPLHGFRSGIGTRMAIMELKISQELASIDQDPLFLVFLELQKAYDTVEQDILITTLEGYGAGPRVCGLLENF